MNKNKLIYSFIIAAASLGLTSQVNAASLSFSIQEYTGANTQVDFVIKDINPNTVNIKASVNSAAPNQTGDLVSIFFDLQRDTLKNTLVVDSSSIVSKPTTSLAVSTTKGKYKLYVDQSWSTLDNVTPLDNNNNLKGAGSLDRDFKVGIQIGHQGLVDDYKTISFNISSIQGLTTNDFLAQRFGARLQSVGTDKNDSSKLEGKQVTEIPEPNLVISLIGLFLLLLRNRFKNDSNYK